MVHIHGFTDCREPKDVIFIWDASDSIPPSAFLQQISYGARVINRLVLDPSNGSAFGAVVFSRNVEAVPLMPFKTAPEVTDAIRLLPHEQCETNTHLGIELMHELFKTQGRAGVEKVAILVTDGRSTRPALTLEAAERAKSQNITIITVSIGYEAEEDVLRALATSPKHAFIKPSSKNLVTLADKTLTAICEGESALPY